MNRITKLIVLSLCLFCMHFAYAGNGSCGPSCPPKECPKPCPPKPCPKPCPPAPCPKPCPPKPCKPCPPVCFERGYPDTQCCIPSAYNEPANYELGPCPWDFWFDVSFTYWEAYQEGMDLAVSTTELNNVVLAPENSSILYQDTSFKPGFKVGLGMDLGIDHWSGLLEYTWFRSTTTTSAAAPADARGGIAIWNLVNWLNRQVNVNAASISSSWKLNMDLLDAALTRPYYQGTHLIVAPFGGIRAQWIRQNLSIDADIFTSSTAIPALAAVSQNKSNSWAVGPRAGFQGEWHLGWGFRFEGDVAASLLYTRYTKIAHSQSPSTTNVGAASPSVSTSGYNCLRAGNELNLGLGWGSYFDCRNYHFDLLLTYDFQVFWNQNMMRQISDLFADGTGHSPSNLYLQGLTIRAQFDF